MSLKDPPLNTSKEKLIKLPKIHSKCTPILQPKNLIRSYLGSEPYQRPKHENRIHNRWNSERPWKHQAASCKRRHLSKQASSFLLKPVNKQPENDAEIWEKKSWPEASYYPNPILFITHVMMQRLPTTATFENLSLRPAPNFFGVPWHTPIARAEHTTENWFFFLCVCVLYAEGWSIHLWVLMIWVL